jgi:hypothetical protein
MRYLRKIGPDIVAVPRIGALFQRVAAAALFMLGSAGVLVALREPPSWNILGIGALGALTAIVGAILLQPPPTCRIDRARQVLITKKGRRGSPKEMPIHPTGARMTISRDGEGSSTYRLYLEHTGGRIKLVESPLGFNRIKTLAEELGQFLSVDSHVDRLYTIPGAFRPQSLPGAGPNRFYPNKDEFESIAPPSQAQFELEELHAGAKTCT